MENVHINNVCHTKKKFSDQVHTNDGCFITEMLQILLPRSRESKSRTWGTLFQLSPSAGLEVPSSPPTTWFVTCKICCIKSIIRRMHSWPAISIQTIAITSKSSKYKLIQVMNQPGLFLLFLLPPLLMSCFV